MIKRSSEEDLKTIPEGSLSQVLAEPAKFINIRIS